MKNIIISTGGSGGHVIPALILLDHLKEKFNLFLVSDKRGSKFIDKEKYFFELIDVPNIFSSIFMFPINLASFLFSIIKTYKYLKEKKIDTLISTGGYMSLPFCISSKLLKINIYLFEPNMVIGRTNKLILNFSKKIICYQDEIIGFPKKFRKKIFIIKPLLKKEFYDLSKNLNKKISSPINILVLGGSQGAKIFDTKIKDVILKLSEFYKINITQQLYDTKNLPQIKLAYNKMHITHDLFKFKKELYNDSNFFDLAITRCGASAMSELSFLAIPFIAIPFPYAKDNHQFYNAKYYYDKKCCWLFDQKNFDDNKLANFIVNFINNQKDYNSKKENLLKISYQNTWNNINEKLLELIDEN